MALAIPSQVSAANVNAELGVSLTSEIKLSNTWVHNLAAIPLSFISSSTLDATTLGAVQSVTAPSDATVARLRLWGGGAGSSSSSPYGGGGGSGFTLKTINVVGGSTVVSCVVGLRGSPATTGTNGGTTTVTVNSVNYTATGGTGSTSGGSGGFGTNGDVLQVGGTGLSGTRPTRGGNAGGQSYGGGLGGLGAAGQTPGGGGGTSTGGANFGGHGRVIIDWYKPNTINYGKLRWGINFPGRTVGYNSFGEGATNSPAYNLSGDINLSAFSVQGPGGTAEAQVYIQIQNNGTFRLYATGAGGSSQFTQTWLTSGVNSDYTARVELSGGSMSAGSSTVNVDHPLSSDRIWINYISSSGSYTVGPDATGNLIIKSAGTELIRRKFTMSTSASVEIA